MLEIGAEVSLIALCQQAFGIVDHRSVEERLLETWIDLGIQRAPITETLLYPHPNPRLAKPGPAEFQVFLQGRMATIGIPLSVTASLCLPLTGDSLLAM